MHKLKLDFAVCVFHTNIKQLFVYFIPVVNLLAFIQLYSDFVYCVCCLYLLRFNIVMGEMQIGIISELRDFKFRNVPVRVGH